MESPVITAWTTTGVEDPDHYCDNAQPWCLRPWGHDGFCDDTPTRTETP